MKLQSFYLKKLEILCAVFLIFMSLAPSVYVRAKTGNTERIEENMPPEVKADKVRIRILNSRVCPTISNFALYHAPPH